MPLRFALAFLLFLLGCGPLVQRDLRLEYFDQARALGLSPVYPPRGEVQVGDVFLVFTPRKGGINEATALYLGHMHSMRDQALAYLSSRDNIGVLMPSGTGTVGKLGKMEDLPAVNFPTITGSAASSASLGAIAPVISGLFSVGKADSVSMKFVDVRAFGVPYLTAAVSAPDFQRSICPTLSRRVDTMFQLLEYDRNDPDAVSPCGDAAAALEGQNCTIHIVTRTYLTREIQFTYNQRRRIGGSASTVTTFAGPTPVAAAPSVPSVTLSIDASTTPDTATSVVNALKAPASANSGTIAASVVSETSQGLAFDQKFRDPLTIAYESATVSLREADRLCPAHN